MQNLTLQNNYSLQGATITFYVDELPEKLNLGGEQTLAVRQFPGGGVDIQTLGAIDDEIKWSGIFWFESALDRALILDTMRTNGYPLDLTLGTIARKVVISKFTYDYMNDYYIPYSITLQPYNPYGLNGTYNGVDETSGTTASTASSTTATTTASVTATTATPQTQKNYTFTSGDTLWKLAVAYYGDGTQWSKIADANNIADPTNIAIGTIVTIPT